MADKVKLKKDGVTAEVYTTSAVDSKQNEKANASDVYTKSSVDFKLSAKQDKLVSGTNIKTVNWNSILGSGNIAVTASLPSSGSMATLSLTDRLNLENAPYGIKFSTANYAVTNMEAGQVSITLGKYVNNDASASVTFHAGSKGQGTWRVSAIATGITWVTSVTCVAESVSNTGFKIWVRRLVDTSSNSNSGTIKVDWIAVKYW